MDSKQVRTITFNGEEEKWRVWKGKVLAFAMYKGFISALTDEKPLINEDEFYAKGMSQLEKRRYEANQQAYAFLALSCEGIAYGYVENCKSSRAPQGDAQQAWKNLLDRFEPTDLETEYATLEEGFNSCELTDEGPDKWFQELEYWNQRLGRVKMEFKRNEIQLKTYIVSKLPDDYAMIKVKVSGELESMSISKLKKIIINFHNSKIRKRGEIVALNTEGTKDTRKEGFRGKCFKCGKKGHRAANCKATSLKCEHCGKTGHLSNKCWYKKSSEHDEDHQGLFVGCIEHSIGKRDLWMLDSGATVHVANSSSSLSNPKAINDSVTVGNGDRVPVTKEGNTRVGKLRLQNVKFTPGFVKNIVSLPKLLKEGYEIKNGNDKEISVVKNGEVMTARIGNDGLYYFNGSKQEMALSATTKRGFSCSLEYAHKVFGHTDTKTTKATAAELGWKLTTRTMPLCGACALAKARAKGVKKKAPKKASEPGERLFIDLSGPYKKSQAQSEYWLLVIDDFSGKAWSAFLKSKTHAGKLVKDHIKFLEVKGMKVKYVRSDNSGEHVKALKDMSKELNFEIELTSPHTPQMNGRVERVFPTILNRANAMMFDAKLTNDLQAKLWPEFIATATVLYNLTKRAGQDKCNEVLFAGKDAKLGRLRHMVIPGSVCYVKNPMNKGKLAEKSTKCIVLGYADYHTDDTYRLYNPKTKSVLISRNVRVAPFHGGIKPEDGMEDAIEIDSDEEEPIDNNDLKPDMNQLKKKGSHETESAQRNVHSRLERELSRLNTSYNQTVRPESNTDDNNQEKNEISNALFTATLQSDPGTPKQFKDIEKTANPEGWYEAVNKELNSIRERKVFGEHLNELPKGSRALTTRWVFKEKENGVMKGRLVVQGYNQIPGVDYTESFSPVAANQTIHSIFALYLYQKYKLNKDWEIELIDVETAFLNANLEETVYVTKPEGLQQEGKFIKLNKALYGLVQAPRAWFKRMKESMLNIKGCNVKQSRIDPCLFYVRDFNETLKAMVSVYVDDCIIAGDKTYVKWIKEKLKSDFKIKELGKLKKYLGVSYSEKKDEVGAYIEANLTNYMKQLATDYEEDFGSIKEQHNPGYRSTKIEEDNKEGTINTAKTQAKYRSYVGRLMFAVNKCIPQAASAIRELCEKLDEPTHLDWKKLDRMIGYLKTVEPMKVRVPKNLKAEIYVDSDYATNKKDRKSITGMISTIGGCITGWKSGKQTGITLSSTEAEYVALSIAGTEAKFIANLLHEITRKKMSGIIYCDNQGAIFLANNQQMGQRTKHIDIRYKFVNEMIEQGEIQIVYIKSEENVADVLSKPTTNTVFKVLSKRITEGSSLSRLKEKCEATGSASNGKGVERN